jgi:hypothetical protein
MPTYTPIGSGGAMFGACYDGELERVHAHGDGGGDLNLVDHAGCSGL